MAYGTVRYGITVRYGWFLGEGYGTELRYVFFAYGTEKGTVVFVLRLKIVFVPNSNGTVISL